MQIPRQQQLILSLQVCVNVCQPNIRRKLGYNLFGQSRKLLHFDGTSSINRAHNCTCYNLVGFLNGLGKVIWTHFRGTEGPDNILLLGLGELMFCGERR